MYILGLWDGHDSGAALLRDGEIVFAANEERFTKRKLEVNFPYNAIYAALKYEGIKPTDVEEIAFSTTEFTKTLERIFPPMKEIYYQFRRRKIPKPRFEDFRHNIKYSLTGVGILPMCGSISSSIISKKLRHMGFRKFRLHIVEHHAAHAATAAFTSQFDRAMVLTLDGLGDGLSGSVSSLENGKIERLMSIRARDSAGIFFEQITNILGFRELEDEGKVMAMADYSYPFPFEENKFKDFFVLEGTKLTAKYSPLRQFKLIQKIAWQMPREQVAYMAQQMMERVVSKLASNLIDKYGFKDVVFAGGVMSNIKTNMEIRNLDALEHWYIFPHMGDGGIALGAALQTNYLMTGRSKYKFSAYLGPEYDHETIEKELKGTKGILFSEDSDPEGHAAELIGSDKYIFWFQGRMEYGPRALGNRSILARSDSDGLKDRLNLYVKKREWFQPFAPSMLESEAPRLLEYDSKGADKFMTMAYKVRDDARPLTKSVVQIDGTARPQMVAGDNARYMKLLERLGRGKTGAGLVLNTSFNIHGKPIVMSPADAIATMRETKTRYMFVGNYFVENRSGLK